MNTPVKHIKSTALCNKQRRFKEFATETQSWGWVVMKQRMGVGRVKNPFRGRGGWVGRLQRVNN